MAEGDLRALVVDDEPLARQEMRYLLDRMDDVATCDEAATGLEAVERLQRGAYDVVFLDIRMPGLSGLEAVRLINGLPRPPRVVFVTAYEEYALAAFDVAAVDYLLKPVSEARLRRALDRVRARGPAPGPVDPTASVARTLVPVEKDRRTLLLRAADVQFVEADGHTTNVYASGKKYRCRLKLGELESRLAADGFLRVHRGYLVNLAHVREVVPFFSGTYLLRLEGPGGAEVPVSRAAARRLRGILAL